VRDKTLHLVQVLLTPYSVLCTPYSLVRIPSLLRTLYSVLLTPYSILRTSLLVTPPRSLPDPMLACLRHVGYIFYARVWGSGRSPERKRTKKDGQDGQNRRCFWSSDPLLFFKQLSMVKVDVLDVLSQNGACSSQHGLSTPRQRCRL
jgi:hypothetical protein